MLIKRTELPFNILNTVITLEEESIKICEIWKGIVKYAFNEDEMVRHMSVIIIEYWQSFINLICKANDIPVFHITEKDIRKMSMQSAIAPITYERVMDTFFKDK